MHLNCHFHLACPKTITPCILMIWTKWVDWNINWQALKEELSHSAVSKYQSQWPVCICCPWLCHKPPKMLKGIPICLHANAIQFIHPPLPTLSFAAYVHKSILYTCAYVCCYSVTKLCLTLCDPMYYSTPGSSVHGISQVRILERIAISFFLHLYSCLTNRFISTIFLDSIYRESNKWYLFFSF